MKNRNLLTLFTLIFPLHGCGSSGGEWSYFPDNDGSTHSSRSGSEPINGGSHLSGKPSDQLDPFDNFTYTGIYPEDEELAAKAIWEDKIRGESFTDYFRFTKGPVNIVKITRQESESIEGATIPLGSTLETLLTNLKEGVTFKSIGMSADSPSIKTFVLHIEGSASPQKKSVITGERPVLANNVYVGPFSRLESPLNFIDKDTLKTTLKVDEDLLNAGVVKIAARDYKDSPSPFNGAFNEVFRGEKNGIFYFATQSFVERAAVRRGRQAYLNGHVNNLIVSGGAILTLGREEHATVKNLRFDQVKPGQPILLGLELAFWPKENEPLLYVKDAILNNDGVSPKIFFTFDGVADGVLPDQDEFSLTALSYKLFQGAPPEIESGDSFSYKNHVYSYEAKLVASNRVKINVKRRPKAPGSRGSMPINVFLSNAQLAEKTASNLQNQMSSSLHTMLTAGLHTTAQGFAATPGVSRLSLQHDGANVNTNGAVARFNVGGTDIMALGQAMTRHKATDGSGYGMALLAGKTLGANATQLTLFGGAQASMTSCSKAAEKVSLSVNENRIDAVAGLSLRRNNAFCISAVGGVKLAATQNVNTQSMYMVDAPTFNTPTMFGALEASFNTTAGQMAASASTLGFNVGFKTGF